MGEQLVETLKLISLFAVAIAVLGASVWTYWGLGLTLGLVGVAVGLALFSYTGYATFNLAAAV